MTTEACTITFNLSALTATYSKAMAKREHVPLVCSNVTGYTAANMYAKLCKSNDGEEVTHSHFTLSGATFVGELELDAAGVLAFFETANATPLKRLRFTLKLYANATGTGTPIITDDEVYIINNPFTSAMEA